MLEFIPQVEAGDDHDLGGQGPAIRDPKSAFSAFIGELRAAGYQIGERGVFADDAEVVRGIAVCKEFYRTVSRKLMLENMDAMMNGDIGGFQKGGGGRCQGVLQSQGLRVKASTL